MLPRRLGVASWQNGGIAAGADIDEGTNPPARKCSRKVKKAHFYFTRHRAEGARGSQLFLYQLNRVPNAVCMIGADRRLGPALTRIGTQSQHRMKCQLFDPQHIHRIQSRSNGRMCKFCVRTACNLGGRDDRRKLPTATKPLPLPPDWQIQRETNPARAEMSRERFRCKSRGDNAQRGGDINRGVCQPRPMFVSGQQSFDFEHVDLPGPAMRPLKLLITGEICVPELWSRECLQRNTGVDNEGTVDLCKLCCRTCATHFASFASRQDLRSPRC